MKSIIRNIVIILVSIIILTAFIYYVYYPNQYYYHQNNIPKSNYILQANVTFTRNDDWNAGIQTIHGQDIGIRLPNGTNLILLSLCQYFKVNDSINIQVLTYGNPDNNSIRITGVNFSQQIIPVSEYCGYVSKI